MGQGDQSFQANGYSSMMYNPMMSQLRGSQIYIPMQGDMTAGMQMMIPYGYNPYIQPMQQMPMMQPTLQSQMLKVSEEKEDDDEDGEASP